MQDPKKSPKIDISAPSDNFVGLYLRNWGTYRHSEKNLLSSNISSTCLHNMVNFGPLAAEIVLLVWGTPANFNVFRRLGSVTARYSSSGRQPNFAALNRGRHLYSAGRPSSWALAHILVIYVFYMLLVWWRCYFIWMSFVELWLPGSGRSSWLRWWIYC